MQFAEEGRLYETSSLDHCATRASLAKASPACDRSQPLETGLLHPELSIEPDKNATSCLVEPNARGVKQNDFGLKAMQTLNIDVRTTFP